MKRVKGETLEVAWPNMSTADRERVADQTAKALLQLRTFESPRIQNVEGKPVFDSMLFLGGGLETPHGPLSSDDELWKEMETGISHVPEKARRNLRLRMPRASPYVLTHGDLTDINIIVNEGNLAGILDWERAAYFPVWWEFAAARIGNSEADAEWKALLREHMPAHTEGQQFWLDYYALRAYPDFRNEQGEKLFPELMGGDD
ncbi:MAG: hypothetical protein M1819_002984 [Sarea resinae]|nr:MAG: hypothetical protein M1819_002984 [Sarea resinae]